MLAQPAALAIAFALVLGRFAKLDADGSPPALFYFAGLVPWSYVATALARTTGSLADSPRLITTIYFPRAVLPIAALLSPLVDLGLATLSLFVASLALGLSLGPSILLVLPATLLLVFSCLGFGLTLSIANARFRDVRHLVPFATQLLLIASPIAYSLSSIPEPLRVVVAMNPFSSAIALFRAAFTGRGAPSLLEFSISSFVAALALFVGSRLFNRFERTIADVL